MDDLLHGAVDLHIHAFPDVEPRIADDLELARAGAAAGMLALAIKCHMAPTAGRAFLAMKVVPGFTVLGGIALNEQVGGLNPSAVEACLAMGGRIVWFPTLSAEHNKRVKGRPGAGITVFDEAGGLRKEVREILDLAAAGDAVIGTGHLSIPETVALAKAAREQGVRSVLVSHPESKSALMPLDVQRELAAVGVRFERCWLSVLLSKDRAGTIASMVEAIRELGPEATVLATDLGRTGAAAPAEGFRTFLEALLDAGIPERDVRRMSADIPAEVAGL